MTNLTLFVQIAAPALLAVVALVISIGVLIGLKLFVAWGLHFGWRK